MTNAVDGKLWIGIRTDSSVLPVGPVVFPPKPLGRGPDIGRASNEDLAWLVDGKEG
jgi:hypothetical protein